jgi:uncharacterized protein
MANTRLPCLWLLLAGLLASSALRGELPVPALTGRVVDQARMLSKADRDQLESRIRSFEAATGGQVAVLTVTRLAGDSIEEFSMRVAESWKIGRKGVDNGALLVISKEDRKIRLEIGYGWEGQVNDARAGDIIRGMGPWFREGRYAQGIDFALAELQMHVTGQRPVNAPLARRSSRRESPSGFVVMLVVLIAVVSLFSRMHYSRYGRGPVIFLGGGGGFRGGGGFGGGGGFSGGGGSFGGGGASGGW